MVLENLVLGALLHDVSSPPHNRLGSPTRSRPIGCLRNDPNRMFHRLVFAVKRRCNDFWLMSLVTMFLSIYCGLLMSIYDHLCLSSYFATLFSCHGAHQVPNIFTRFCIRGDTQPSQVQHIQKKFPSLATILPEWPVDVWKRIRFAISDVL